MSRRALQTGFSAIELMISLFIAVAFVGAGYQLYSVIVKDGGEAKLRAKANDIAYEKLRFYSAQATNPCTSVTPTPTPTIPNANDLPNATITVTISCPYSTDPVSKVSVTVLYGSPQQGVTHASFVKN
jgi:Tfp pilus assembly protein PilE